jgi:hypothetical protein
VVDDGTALAGGEREKVVGTMAKVVGLSLSQPGAWSMLRAGCRVISLPTGSTPPRYRGEVLIHAAAVCSHDDFDDAVRRMVAHRLLPAGVRAPWRADVPVGGFVARARLLDVQWVEQASNFSDGQRHVAVFGYVDPLPCFVPAPAPSTIAMPFELDGDVFAKALELASMVETDADLRAVSSVWKEAPRRSRARSRVVETVGAEARA